MKKKITIRKKKFERDPYLEGITNRPESAAEKAYKQSLGSDQSCTLDCNCEHNCKCYPAKSFSKVRRDPPSHLEKQLEASIQKQLDANVPDPRPEKDPERLLVHLVEMIKAGYRNQAITSIRMRGKTLAWATDALAAIEWAMKEPTLKGERT